MRASIRFSYGSSTVWQIAELEKNYNFLVWTSQGSMETWLSFQLHSDQGSRRGFSGRVAVYIIRWHRLSFNRLDHGFLLASHCPEFWDKSDGPQLSSGIPRFYPTSLLYNMKVSVVLSSSLVVCGWCTVDRFWPSFTKAEKPLSRSPVFLALLKTR